MIRETNMSSAGSRPSANLPILDAGLKLKRLNSPHSLTFADRSDNDPAIKLTAGIRENSHSWLDG